MHTSGQQERGRGGRGRHQVDYYKKFSSTVISAQPTEEAHARPGLVSVRKVTSHIFTKFGNEDEYVGEE